MKWFFVLVIVVGHADYALSEHLPIFSRCVRSHLGLLHQARVYRPFEFVIPGTTDAADEGSLPCPAPASRFGNLSDSGSI